MANQNISSLINGLSYAVVAVTAGATTKIVTGVAGKQINIMGIELRFATGEGSITFKSGSTAITGVMHAVVGGGISAWNHLPNMPCLVCADGEDLNITSATSTIDGWIVYYIA